jgi:hypothetical protein
MSPRVSFLRLLFGRVASAFFKADNGVRFSASIAIFAQSVAIVSPVKFKGFVCVDTTQKNNRRLLVLRAAQCLNL